MTDYEIIKAAMKLARYAHEGQVDKAGDEYIFHPVMVALQCSTAKEKAVALLHDTLEDCKDKVSYDTITEAFGDEAETIGREIADAVQLLTSDATPANAASNEGDKSGTAYWGSEYLQYVQNLKDSGNELAIAVKYADLSMNMDLSRIAEPTQRDYDRIEKKYKPALRILRGEEHL